MWSRTLQPIGQHLSPVTDIMVLLVRIRLTEVVVETFKSHKLLQTGSNTTLFHQPTNQRTAFPTTYRLYPYTILKAKQACALAGEHNKDECGVARVCLFYLLPSNDLTCSFVTGWGKSCLPRLEPECLMWHECFALWLSVSVPSRLTALQRGSQRVSSHYQTECEEFSTSADYET